MRAEKDAMQEVIDLKDLTVGKTVHLVSGPVAYIEWEPGDGLKYRVIFVSLPPAITKALGCGDTQVTLEPHYGKSSVTFTFDRDSIFHINYAMEKLIAIDGFDEESVSFYCILINWALSRSMAVSGYAEDLWNEVAHRWIKNQDIALVE